MYLTSKIHSTIKENILQSEEYVKRFRFERKRFAIDTRRNSRIILSVRLFLQLRLLSREVEGLAR